jgi:hypothetical protein
MFTNAERNELVGRILLILEQDKVGTASKRKELAEKLIDDAREYLGGRYATRSKANPAIGIHGVDASILSADEIPGHRPKKEV